MKNPGDRFHCRVCGYMVYKKDEVGPLPSGELVHLDCALIDDKEKRQRLVDVLDLCSGCRSQYL